LFELQICFARKEKKIVEREKKEEIKKHIKSKAIKSRDFSLEIHLLAFISGEC
jgi:hypothetical protein